MKELFFRLGFVAIILLYSAMVVWFSLKQGAAINAGYIPNL